MKTSLGKTWTLVRGGYEAYHKTALCNLRYLAMLFFLNQTVIDAFSENRHGINGHLTNEHLFQVDYPRRCWVELVIHP